MGLRGDGVCVCVLAENLKKECVRTLIFLFDLIPESSALPVLIMQMIFFF